MQESSHSKDRTRR